MRLIEVRPGVFFPDEGPSLRPFEIAILQGAANGESASDTAARVHYSAETVRAAFKAVYSKLGANNKTHAVAIVFRAGLIN